MHARRGVTGDEGERQDVEGEALALRGVGHGGPLRSFPSRRGMAQPGARPVDVRDELSQLAKGLQDRPRR